MTSLEDYVNAQSDYDSSDVTSAIAAAAKRIGSDLGETISVSTTDQNLIVSVGEMALIMLRNKFQSRLARDDPSLAGELPGDAEASQKSLLTKQESNYAYLEHSRPSEWGNDDDWLDYDYSDQNA